MDWWFLKKIEDPDDNHIVFLYNDYENKEPFIEWYKLYLLVWNNKVHIVDGKIYLDDVFFYSRRFW